MAGAAAGMSATFAAPIAAVLLSVELLLFEWKPRSFVPVTLASATAAAARRYVMGLGPLFPVAAHPAFIGPAGLAGCLVVGLLAGVLSALPTQAVYASEDAFACLPIHWMWWPAIGGLVIGLGGLEAGVRPTEGAGFWPLVGMGAILGRTMRSPLTGVVFAVELTHDVNMLLPLLLATVIAHAFTVLTLRRSILTEKVSRRGYHLSREYSVDPLEIIFVREAVVAYPGEPLRSVVYRMAETGLTRFPVVDPAQGGKLLGMISRKDLLKASALSLDAERRRERVLAFSS